MRRNLKEEVTPPFAAIRARKRRILEAEQLEKSKQIPQRVFRGGYGPRRQLAEELDAEEP